MATIEENDEGDGVGSHAEPVETSHNMTDVLLTLGRLEERTKSLPSLGKQFGATFLGAAAVAAFCLTIFAVWVPREIDGLKSDIVSEITLQRQQLELLTKDVAEVKGLSQVTIESLQSLHRNVSTMALGQRQREGRFVEMRTFVSGLEAKDDLLLGAYTGDVAKMVSVISDLPEADRNKLFSIMAVGLLRDQLTPIAND